MNIQQYKLYTIYFEKSIIILKEVTTNTKYGVIRFSLTFENSEILSSIAF